MTPIPEIRQLDILLEKYFHKKIKILHQNVKPLTAPGENYGSIMASLTLTIEEDNHEKELNLVAKLIPTNEMLREMFQVSVTFIKELRVYRKIVPILAELENEFGILENRASDLFAKCFGGRSNLHEEEGVVDDDSVLLLENLKLLGFEVGNRLEGFNFEISKFVLENLARFHATPIALKHLKPNIYKQIVVTTLDTPQTSSGMEADKCFKFTNGIKEIIFKNPKYEDKVNDVLKCLTRKFTEIFYEITDPKETFVTFVHSDFWVNNMMIKQDKHKKPEKLIILDFQAPQNHTLVSDLIFFMYTSISPSVLYENVDDFIKIYYDSFISRLKEFNLDLEKFSWDAFMHEIKKNALNILSQILIMYKPILLERGHVKDMNDVKEEDFVNLEGITEDCKTRILNTFNQFVEKGWI